MVFVNLSFWTANCWHSSYFSNCGSKDWQTDKPWDRSSKAKLKKYIINQHQIEFKLMWLINSKNLIDPNISKLFGGRYFHLTDILSVMSIKIVSKKKMVLLRFLNCNSDLPTVGWRIKSERWGRIVKGCIETFVNPENRKSWNFKFICSP